MGKVVCIIQTRMGSTRLPGKVMLELCGKSVLSHVIDRVKQSKEVDEIIIATTSLEKDNIIEQESINCKVKVFRGSEEDVLSRYYYAAKENNADIVVRITSDCPLIDPIIIDKIIGFYNVNNYDIVTNGGSDLSQRTYPRGLDTEVFSFEMLEEAFKKSNQQYQREHVTPYIYENSDKIFYYKNEIDCSNYRWTLDTKEDFELIKIIYEHFYYQNLNFYLEEIKLFIDNNPEIANLNANIEQKKIY